MATTILRMRMGTIFKMRSSCGVKGILGRGPPKTSAASSMHLANFVAAASLVRLCMIMVRHGHATSASSLAALRKS